MNELKIWLTSFISFIVLDFIWFTTFAAEFTKQKLGGLVRLNSSGAIDANLKPAIIVYALMAMAITFFVFPKVQNMPNFKAALWSALLGVIMFGLYELTNYTFIKNWSLTFVAVDIIWGGAAFFLTMLLIKFIF